MRKGKRKMKNEINLNWWNSSSIILHTHWLLTTHTQISLAKKILSFQGQAISCPNYVSVVLY